MLIKTENELKELISRALQARAVGIDTEFVWERTFYPQLGLIQLSIEQECYLIDPVAIEDLSPLGELLSSASVVKILHDAQQDLMILKTATGADPKNIFDTRLAYGFCSDSSILSLSALLEKTLNISLPKTETRANWLMRPLTDKMFDYACDDVKHSTELMNFIMDSAEKQNTDLWLKDELKKYDCPSLYTEIDPYEYFRKIKGIDQLKGKNLAVLQELAAWREKVAREKNRPRGHIIHNNILIGLSYKCPQTLEDLRKIDRISPNSIKMYGKDLIKCIEKGMNISPELQPLEISRFINKKLARQIYEVIQLKAIVFNIDPALICSRKELTM
ncbi:MAG: HRDC domain-containing protein, partial [Victivallales bacterium]|nr:HRDC domain-containing protein [Victivallales bacterium]